jgi:molecular chaperone GrpE
MKKEDQALLNQLKRVQADFENYKKRVEKENQEIIKKANTELIKELLPILDSFEKAIPTIKDEGIKLIHKELITRLEKQGLKRIHTEGKRFDIKFHEAVMTVKTKKEDNLIIEEVEPGYTFKDKVIRHAKVIVNKKQ